MPLIATPGAINANSYVTEPEADAYFSTRTYASAWDSVDDAEATLISASQMLDWFMNWEGMKADSGQAMEWPRQDAYDGDGVLIDKTTIPIRIKHATFEMALFSLEEDRVAEGDLDGFASMKIGPLALKSDAAYTRSSTKKAIPQHVRQMLLNFILSPGRLIRG